MPYSKKYDKQRKKWVIVNKETGKVMGTHPSEEAANKQLAALNANEGGMAGEGGGGPEEMMNQMMK